MGIQRLQASQDGGTDFSKLSPFLSNANNVTPSVGVGSWETIYSVQGKGLLSTVKFAFMGKPASGGYQSTLKITCDGVVVYSGTIQSTSTDMYVSGIITNPNYFFDYGSNKTNNVQLNGTSLPTSSIRPHPSIDEGYGLALSDFYIPFNSSLLIEYKPVLGTNTYRYEIKGGLLL